MRYQRKSWSLAAIESAIYEKMKKIGGRFLVIDEKAQQLLSDNQNKKILLCEQSIYLY